MNNIFVAVSKNGKPLVEGWYEDAEGNYFQLIASPPPSEDEIEVVVAKIFYSYPGDDNEEVSIKKGIEEVKELMAGYAASKATVSGKELDDESYWKIRCEAAEATIILMDKPKNWSEEENYQFLKWREAYGIWQNKITTLSPATVSNGDAASQKDNCEEMKNAFMSSLLVLRSMLNRAGLTSGVETADYLLNKYEQK
jgi:hypothetical protein